MKKRLTYWRESLLELTARHVQALILVLGYLLVGWLIVQGDSKIRSDLRYALGTASAQLSPVLVAYDVAGDFNAREVMELNLPELQQAADTWPKFHLPIYLQVLSVPEKVLFDSRSKKIGDYGDSEGFSPNIEFGSLRRNRPLLYVDWSPSREGRWILRAAVTSPDYFKAHAWRLALLLLPLIGFSKFVLTSDEVRLRRRFDRLVGSMPVLLREARAEKTLIQEVPRIISHMLDFDSIAIYLLEGDRIVPKAYFSRERRDPEAFLHSTDDLPILTQDEYPESRAIRDNKPVMVDPERELDKIHPVKYEAAGPRPYVIVPIQGGGDGAPVGLLTAQRHAGLKEQHGSFLLGCAEIVALLLEIVRNREALERLYRKMIQNTRIETLGTVVPFITHNMKTPLVVVEGLADSILEDFGILDRLELEKRISEIKAQTNLSFQLIRSISLYNSLDNAPASLVNVRQGLERVCGFFSGYFRIKNIELTQRSEAGFEPTIKMEELDFVQVITNLLINADDAFSEMRQRGDELMSRSNLKIEVVLERAGDRVRILVIDDGPGVRPEHLPRVFEQKFTTKDYGTGVGLPYCRRVVEEAGGVITVDSIYGKGTTVSVVIPTAKEEGR